MKKVFTTALAVTMATAALGTAAFAADVNTPTTLTNENQSVSIPVTGEYIDQKKSDEIISMDVEWGAMNFTYAATQQGTWNPATHAYDNSSQQAGWVGTTTSDIKVTNHSNVAVTASFTFAPAESYNAVTGTFSKATADLDAGVENDYENAANDTVKFTIGGTMGDSVKDTATQIGTITVSVAKKAAE